MEGMFGWLEKHAATISALSTVAYSAMTLWIIAESKRARKDDRMPCIVIRAREEESVVTPLGMTMPAWWLRLVNIGSGPAFIDHFETIDLPGYANGVHTNDIDSALGPDVGDPAQQIAFAQGTPNDLRDPKVIVIVRYRDVFGRRFESVHSDGRLRHRML